MNQKISVFYDHKMVVNLILESPSPNKPKDVVKQWQEKYGEHLQFDAVTPVSVEQITLAHDKEHVAAVLNLKRKNGFGTRHKEVADSLVWTSGSFLSAARHALKTGIAVSPTSGFHHAGYNYVRGYCTFNGLLISAQVLLSEGVKKIGIVDCDYHFGDGSEHIIQHLNLSDNIRHITANQNYERQNNIFKEQLPLLLESLDDCDIIFYQAGADAHINDPLGGFLDNEELRWRDRLVFEYCNIKSIPCVWNLAGGYQEDMINGVRNIQKVLDIHNTTMEECLAVYAYGNE
jgi:acetoin utilization deacetylase AcuC-like enzyme